MKRLARYFIGSIACAFAAAAWAADECSDLLLPSADQIASAETDLRDVSDKYEQALGLYRDPFAMAFTLEQGERIFRELSVRKFKGKSTPSPLAIVNLNLKKTYLGPSSYNEKLVRWVLDDARRFIGTPQAQRTLLQSNLLALKYTGEYLRRFKQPEKVVDRDGDKADQEQKPQPPAKQDEQKEARDKEDNQPPEYPDLPKEYKPTSKDTQKNKGKGKGAEHRLAEANFVTPFFGQRYFTEVIRGAAHPFREGDLPIDLPPPRAPGETERHLKVRTFGKLEVSLFMPPLYEPRQPSDPRVTLSRSSSGGYVLTLKEDIPEVTIPLVEGSGLRLLPPLRDTLTRPVGFKNEEWPSEVHTDVFAKFGREDGKTRPLVVAQAIANHLASKYLYSVGARPETDPIEALRAGAFQCDMAAYAMLGILRDSYGIPSRIVGGFRAKQHRHEADKSFLVVPGEAHAWVEVFHDGQWHLFDPTPVRKDKKDDKKGGRSEYSDRNLPNTPKPENEDGSQDGDGQEEHEEPEGHEAPEGKDGSEGQNSSDQQSEKSRQEQKDAAQGSGTGVPETNTSTKESGSGQDSKSSEEHQKRLEKTTQERIDKAEKEQKAAKTADEKGSAAKDKALTRDDLADQLELGSLDLKPSTDRNPLRERVLRVLLQWALEPSQRGFDTQQRLTLISNMIPRSNDSSIKQIFQRGVSAHAKEHPPLKLWIDQFVRSLPNEDLNKSYQELHRLRLALDTYAAVLDRDGRIQDPVELRETLAEITRHLEALEHPDAADIGIVKDLTLKLANVARQLLKLDYGLDTVGPNPSTLTIADKLKKGQLNDIRLLSILTPLSDFVLNSTPRPESIMVRSWQRDVKKQNGRDVLPLQRFSDLPRTLLGQPGKSLEENMQQGTAYVSTRRKRVKIPTGYGEQEAERITIVLYDTSGSMSGDPARFQAGLISAFTSRALSDVSPSGRVRHRVVIVPFDSEPQEPVRVTTPTEAIDIIRNYRSKLANTNGGTDIQKALLQAMSLIADAEKRTGEPLAAANIILMTDGEASVDLPELYRARQAIDRTTPLQTLFIAINGSNEKLMEFALDSQKMGVERGFYKEFDSQHISELLAEADRPPKQGEKHFYTETSASQLPQEVYRLLEIALQLGAKFSDEIYYGSQYLPAREHLENLERVVWPKNLETIDRPLESWIQKVRQLTRYAVFKDKRVIERVVDDLIVNFERLTGVGFNGMGAREQEHLRHLVRFAAGQEDASW